MVKDQTIYIMIGPPGVGKSSFLRPDSNVVSSDDYLESVAKLKGITYAEAFADNIKDSDRYAKEAYRRFLYLNQFPIYVDRTNLTVKGRAYWFNVLLAEWSKKIGKPPEVVALDFKYIPEIHDEWRAKRNAEGNKVISQEVFDRLYSAYVPPTLDEGFSQIINIIPEKD